MKRGTVRLYGMVGAGMFGDEECITAGGAAKEIERCRAEGCKAIDVYLSSDGGSVNEGLAIHDQIKRFPGDVTVHIDGRAVSIASVIALAGKRLVMPRSALMMIHSPFIFAIGNASKLRKTAADLDVMAETMRGIYCAKTGLSAERVQKIMDDETWLTAAEAKDLGFVDEVTGAEPKKSAASGALDLYRNTPAALRTLGAESALARLEGLLMRQRIGEIARSASAAAAGKIPGAGPTK